jgi:outer membrane protein TolC
MMGARTWFVPLAVTLAAFPIGKPWTAALCAQEVPGTVQLTLEEAKQRALASNKGISLGNLNLQSKVFAIKSAQADYFPKVIGSSIYFHFDNPLGSIETSGGLLLPPISVATFNQDSSFSTVAVAQPLTALLKIRQAVQMARADREIAQAQLDKGTRELLIGVEQLYWGLLAAQRIRAGAATAAAGAEEVAKTGATLARTALLEAKQALQQVENQIADLEQQLKYLLDLPCGTRLVLEEPPLPTYPGNCAEEAVGMALASSPEVHEAEQNVLKARATLKATRVDYLPNVAVVGGYAKQTAASYIQQDINYIGVQGSYTFFEWGKKQHMVRELQAVVAAAEMKLQQTQDDVRQKVQKAWRVLNQSHAALAGAREMVPLREQAAKEAAGLPAQLKAFKDLGEAQVDLVKAELAYRVAFAEWQMLLSKP